MKKNLFLVYFFNCLIISMAAQQNWAAIPCSYMKSVVGINKMFVDSLHNEIILNSVSGSTICNTTYKGLVAYNGIGFHDLDRGVNTHDPNAAAGALLVWGCTTYGNRTLFGGGFYSVGSNTLFTKSIALWNGAVWDTFPTRCFDNAPTNSSGGGFYGFLKYQGKLWMYGGFDTIGKTVTTNLTAYDGNTFTAVPTIPVNYNAPIVKLVAYKNTLVAAGNFYNYPSFNFFRLAQFDGTSWSQVGSGVQGGVSNVCDMVVYNDTLYIAGAYSKADGNAGNYLMKWDGTQLTDAGFGNTFCGYGPIWSLVPFHNRLYAFGGFGCANNQRAFGVAYLENGIWTVPQDSVANNNILSAVAYNDAIYIAGGFKSINGDTNIKKFAKLMCPDFDAATGCVSSIKKLTDNLDVRVFPNPTKDKFILDFKTDPGNISCTFTNTLGQIVHSGTKLNRYKEIDISFFPPGVYFLRVQNGTGQKVFKVIKE